MHHGQPHDWIRLDLNLPGQLIGELALLWRIDVRRALDAKRAAIAAVSSTLAGDGRLDEGGMVAFMQAVNSVRLVLGTLLDITDDGDDEDGLDDPESYEQQLYVYLSWLLEWAVRTLSGNP